jgi:hypothetical protein
MPVRVIAAQEGDVALDVATHGHLKRHATTTYSVNARRRRRCGRRLR